jgi:hypothetical protein
MSTVAYASRLVCVSFVISVVVSLLDYVLDESGYKESLPNRETAFMKLAVMTFEVMVGVFCSRVLMDQVAFFKQVHHV